MRYGKVRYKKRRLKFGDKNPSTSVFYASAQAVALATGSLVLLISMAARYSSLLATRSGMVTPFGTHHGWLKSANERQCFIKALDLDRGQLTGATLRQHRCTLIPR